MRLFAATLIWIADIALKFALGVIMVALIWLPFHYGFGVAFSRLWYGAGLVVGLCINGFLEGCDLFLLGWAKRIAGDR